MKWQWASCRLKSSTILLFIQPFLEQHQRKHQSRHYWSCVRGIHRWLVDYPHKGSEVRMKPFIMVVLHFIPASISRSHPGILFTNHKTSYCQILRSFEAAIYGFIWIGSLCCNAAQTRVAFQRYAIMTTPCLGIWDFSRSYHKMLYRLVKRGLVSISIGMGSRIHIIIIDVHNWSLSYVLFLLFCLRISLPLYLNIYIGLWIWYKKLILIMNVI